MTDAAPSDQLERQYKVRQVTQYQASWTERQRGQPGRFDGRGYSTMKRHVKRHGMDSSGYRERFGLPADYPVVAPAYAQRRSELAKSTGLGTNRTRPADADSVRARSRSTRTG